MTNIHLSRKYTIIKKIHDPMFDAVQPYTTAQSRFTISSNLISTTASFNMKDLLWDSVRACLND